MGLEKSESSEVYTKFFALDVAASQQVRSSLDTQDALLPTAEADRKSITEK